MSTSSCLYGDNRMLFDDDMEDNTKRKSMSEIYSRQKKLARKTVVKIDSSIDDNVELEEEEPSKEMKDGNHIDTGDSYSSYSPVSGSENTIRGDKNDVEVSLTSKIDTVERLVKNNEVEIQLLKEEVENLKNKVFTHHDETIAFLSKIYKILK
ncbi:uncharacterized protein G2W53_010194 [Senna tora]|uniref:Uncharacterized protein n=1 Tax=Senna tora TaxID=362788 RepID=A0A835CB87_9FABA|nr:uncharacterized protein G2W53_010194 [Senna tora]